jgi:hypothetical protein
MSRSFSKVFQRFREVFPKNCTNISGPAGPLRRGPLLRLFGRIKNIVLNQPVVYPLEIFPRIPLLGGEVSGANAVPIFPQIGYDILKVFQLGHFSFNPFGHDNPLKCLVSAKNPPIAIELNRTAIVGMVLTLAETLGNVLRVPVKPEPSTPIDDGFRTATGADSEFCPRGISESLGLSESLGQASLYPLNQSG